MGSTVITPEVAYWLVSRRQDKAKLERLRRDTVWFRKHSDRLHHIRPVLAFEHPGCDQTNTHQNASLVIRPSNTLESITVHIPVKDWHWLPDDEYFLSLLWESLKLNTGNEGDATTISPERHKGLLMLSGHWKETA